MTYGKTANIYLFKVNSRNTGKKCEICLKLTIKTLKYVIDVVLVFLLLNLNIFNIFSTAFVVDLQQVNVSWENNQIISPLNLIRLKSC